MEGEKQKFSDRFKEAMLNQLKAKNTLMLAVGITVLSVFIYLVYVAVNKTISVNMKDIALIVFGNVMAHTNTIINYYFGSSKSSSDKNELLTKKDEPKLSQ